MEIILSEGQRVKKSLRKNEPRKNNQTCPFFTEVQDKGRENRTEKK